MDEIKKLALQRVKQDANDVDIKQLALAQVRGEQTVKTGSSWTDPILNELKAQASSPAMRLVGNMAVRAIGGDPKTNAITSTQARWASEGNKPIVQALSEGALHTGVKFAAGGAGFMVGAGAGMSELAAGLLDPQGISEQVNRVVDEKFTKQGTEADFWERNKIRQDILAATPNKGKMTWKERSKRAADRALEEYDYVTKTLNDSPYNAWLNMQKRFGMLSKKEYQRRFDLLHNSAEGVSALYPQGDTIVKPVATALDYVLKPAHYLAEQVSKIDPAAGFATRIMGELATFKLIHESTRRLTGKTETGEQTNEGVFAKRKSAVVPEDNPRVNSKMVREVVTHAKEQGITELDTPAKVHAATSETVMQALMQKGAEIVSKEKEQAAKKAAEMPAPAKPTAGVSGEKLPASLSKAKPRFIDRVVEFDSDVHKALYIVANDAKGKSKSASRYREWLQGHGLSDLEINKAGQVIRELVRKTADATPAEEVLRIRSEVKAATPAVSKPAKITKPAKQKVVQEPPKAPEQAITFADTPYKKTVDKTYSRHQKAAEAAGKELGFSGEITFEATLPKDKGVIEGKRSVSPRSVDIKARKLMKEGVPYEEALQRVYKEALSGEKSVTTRKAAKERALDLNKAEKKKTIKRSAEDIKAEQAGQRKAGRITRQLGIAFGNKTARRLIGNKHVTFLTERKAAEMLKERGYTDKEMASTRAFHDETTGRSYMIVEHINEATAATDVLHEVGGHAARLGFKEPAFQGILRELREASPESALGKSVAKAKQRVPKDTLPEHYWEEVAMRLLKEPGTFSAKTRVMNYLKGMFRRLGVDVGRLTESDIQLFAERALRKTSEGSKLDVATRIALAETTEQAYKFAREVDPVEAVLAKATYTEAELRAALEKKFTDKGVEDLAAYFEGKAPEKIGTFDEASTKILNGVLEESLAKGLGYEQVWRRRGLSNDQAYTMAKISELFGEQTIKEHIKVHGKQINRKVRNAEKGIYNAPIYEKWHAALLRITPEIYRDKLLAIVETPEQTFSKMGAELHELFRGWAADCNFNKQRELNNCVKQNKVIHDMLTKAEREEFGHLLMNMQPRTSAMLKAKGLPQPTLQTVGPKVKLAYDYFREKLDSYFSRYNMTQRMNGRTPMEYEQNYFPIMYDYAFLADNGLISPNTKLGKVSSAVIEHIDPTWSKDRGAFLNKYGKIVKMEMDPFIIMERFERPFLHAVHYTPFVEAMTNLLHHPFKTDVYNMVSKKMESKKMTFGAYNPDAFKMMTEYINDVARGRVKLVGEGGSNYLGGPSKATKAFNKVLSELNDNLAMSFLTGARFTVTQFGSMTPVVAMAARHLPEAILKEMTAEGRDFLNKNSKHILTRTLDAHSNLIANSLANAKGGYSTIKVGAHKITSKAAAVATLIDYQNARIAWHAYYAKALAEKNPRPARYADSMVIKTQSSGLLQDRAPMQRHLATLSASLFQSYGWTQFNLIKNDFFGRGGFSEGYIDASNLVSKSQPHIRGKAHQQAARKLAKQLGYNEKNITYANALIMAATYVAVSEAGSALYRFLNLREADPSFVGAVSDRLDDIEDDPDANLYYEIATAIGGEAMRYVPAFSGGKHGRGALGATYEFISDVPGAVARGDAIDKGLELVPGYGGIAKPVRKAVEREEENLMFYLILPRDPELTSE